MVAQLDKTYAVGRPWKAITRLMSFSLFEGRAVLQSGRWINPLVFLVHRVAMSRRPRRSIDRPIFIVGTGRSGTTVLGKVLSYHRQCSFLNEPMAVWYSAHPAEDLAGSYSPLPARYRMGAEDASDPVREALTRIYSFYLETTRANRVVDKYPELVFRVSFVLKLFPDARFLFLTRNGIDTCLSIESWSKSHLKVRREESTDWWGVDGRRWSLLVEQILKVDPQYAGIRAEVDGFSGHAERAALDWITAMREGIAAMAGNPDAFMRVSYEELCQRPREVAAAVQTFCGLDSDPGFLDYAAATLRPGKIKAPVGLAPSLVPLFNETQAMLGYREKAFGIGEEPS